MHPKEDEKPSPAPPASIPEEHGNLNGASTAAQQGGHLQSSDRAPSTLDKQIAQERMNADLGTPAGLPRVATSHTARRKQDAPAVPPAVHGAARDMAESDAVQAPDTPGAVDPDVGHLPVARQENTPERELNDPGHMTPSSSPRQLVCWACLECLDSPWCGCQSMPLTRALCFLAGTRCVQFPMTSSYGTQRTAPSTAARGGKGGALPHAERGH